MNIDSPFEQWRLKYMKGMAASRDIMELLALAFEGGRVAAGRELKATYPQGAKVRPAEFIAAASVGVGADFIGTPMMWAEWPTRPERTFVAHDVGCAVNGYGECDCFGGVQK